jgi:hypothetical protein
LENFPDEEDDHNNVDEQTRAVSGESLLTASKTVKMDSASEKIRGKVSFCSTELNIKKFGRDQVKSHI